MIRDECVEQTTQRKIRFEERGRKAIFLNSNEDRFFRVRVDGCVITQALAADWVLSKRDLGEVIIELKGRNVEHGIKQIRATAEFWTTRRLRSGAISGLLVCSQFPRADTSVQRAKQEFSRQFRGPLHVVSHNGEFEFKRVLGYQDP